MVKDVSVFYRGEVHLGRESNVKKESVGEDYVGLARR